MPPWQPAFQMVFLILKIKDLNPLPSDVEDPLTRWSQVLSGEAAPAAERPAIERGLLHSVDA